MKAKTYYAVAHKGVIQHSQPKWNDEGPHTHVPVLFNKAGECRAEIRSIYRPDEDAKAVKVYVFPASSLDNVIERAAKALYHDDRTTVPVSALVHMPIWSKLDDRMRDRYRRLARAAYQAGGFNLSGAVDLDT